MPVVKRMKGRPWERLRQAVFQRDGFRCQIAGPRCTEVATEVDHIVALKDWKGLAVDANGLRNLRSVCKPCHKDRRRPGGTRRNWFD